MNEILEGNDFVPPKIDVACALATALVVRAEQKHYNRILEYSEKLKPEVNVLLGKLLIRKDKIGVQNCTLWKQWSLKHYDLIREDAT